MSEPGLATDRGAGAAPGASEAAQAVAQMARHSYGRLRACLCSRTHDLATAEDALAQALELALALAQWPGQGVPRVPEAWLLTVARRRLMDGQRHEQVEAAALPDLGLLMDSLVEEEPALPDQRLALMFVCTHPAIEPPDRAPLMLQVTLGLSAEQIAAAFWTTPAAMGKRLGRAKARIRQLRLRFEVPDADLWPERMGSVLDALYAAYARGWKSPGELEARKLSTEALWLARVAAALAPDESEAWGLLALLLCSDARAGARRDEHGQYVPLEQQDVRRWNLAQCLEANRALARASATGRRTGRYQLEAAIQCAQAAQRLTGAANHAEIAELYDLLLALVPTPVVRLNRAIARLPLAGAAATADELDAIAQQPGMRAYQPYWAARAHVAAMQGKAGEAHAAYDLAIGLCEDEADRRYLEQRRAGLDAGGRLAAA